MSMHHPLALYRPPVVPLAWLPIHRTRAAHRESSASRRQGLKRSFRPAVSPGDRPDPRGASHAWRVAWFGAGGPYPSYFPGTRAKGMCGGLEGKGKPLGTLRLRSAVIEGLGLDWERKRDGCRETLTMMVGWLDLPFGWCL